MNPLFLSGSRADYGYLKPVAAAFNKQVATIGLKPVDDSPKAVADAAFLAGKEAAHLLQVFTPDMLVVLGDRWEIASACIAATLAGVPIAHIAAGEKTLGAYDDKLRAMIEGAAAIKFALTAQAAELCNGHLAGCTSVRPPEMILEGDGTAIVILHPETAGDNGVIEAGAVCSMLSARGLVPLLIGSNHDVGSAKYAGPSMRLTEFHKRLAAASIIVGNSSAGIIEAPILGTPTVNIGRRQEGRPRAESIFDCGNDLGEIGAGIDRALAFGKKRVSSPYYNPKAIEVITNGIASYLARC